MHPTHPRPPSPPCLPSLPVRFNPAEPDVFATTGSDRGIALYDLRSNTPIRKLVMQARSVLCALRCLAGGRVSRDVHMCSTQSVRYWFLSVALRLPFALMLRACRSSMFALFCLQTKTNAIAWNPMEAFNFTGAQLAL